MKIGEVSKHILELIIMYSTTKFSHNTLRGMSEMTCLLLLSESPKRKVKYKKANNVKECYNNY